MDRCLHELPGIRPSRPVNHSQPQPGWCTRAVVSRMYCAGPSERAKLKSTRSTEAEPIMQCTGIPYCIRRTGDRTDHAVHNSLWISLPYQANRDGPARAPAGTLTWSTTSTSSTSSQNSDGTFLEGRSTPSCFVLRLPQSSTVHFLRDVRLPPVLYYDYRPAGPSRFA